MAKYHIRKDGTPGICRAKGSCPLGGTSEHFDSREEAQVESERRLETTYGVMGDNRMKSEVVLSLEFHPRGADITSKEKPDYETYFRDGILTENEKISLKKVQDITIDEDFKEVSISELSKMKEKVKVKSGENPEVRLLAASRENVGKTTEKVTYLYSFTASDKPPVITKEQKENISKFTSLARKYGFYFEKDDLTRSAMNSESIDLVKKANGSSWEKPIEKVIPPADLRLLKNYSNKIGIELPEYVYGD